MILQRENDLWGEGMIQHNIGFVLQNQGLYQQALVHFQEALTIRQELSSSPTERVYLSETLASIADIHFVRGQYGLALEYFERALHILEQVDVNEAKGSVLISIGGIYHAQRRFDQALEYYERALDIAIEAGDRSTQGIALNNIGLTYHDQGQLTDALDYYQQALTVRREIEDQNGEARTLHNIGSIYRHLSDYDVALEYYHQVLRIMRHMKDVDGEGTTLNSIGALYDDQQEYDEALENYTQALNLIRRAGNVEREGILLNNMGLIHDRMGDIPQALSYYQQAMDAIEMARASAGSEEGRTSFIARYNTLYDRTLILYHRQQQEINAFQASERGRARSFLDALTTSYIQLADSEINALLNREQEAYANRQTVQDALRHARSTIPLNESLIADLEADLEQLEADYAAVQEEIAGRSDQLAALVPGRSAVPELGEIQAALDADTTLLSYWVTDEQTFAFVVTADALDVVELEVSRDEVFNKVETLRRFSNLGEPYPTAAVDLHELLIAPVAEHLTTDHLAIIPHDVLHYLPFAALSDGERFLVDDYTLTLLPSASSLLHIQENTGSAMDNPLLLGNPATDNADLPALNGAEREAEAIADLFGGAPLLGEAATEAEVRNGVAEAGILHIAAHGEFAQAAPLESTLYLTPEGEDDGRLTVREIYALDLQQADLVVLSACETQIDDTGIVHGQLSVDSGDEIIGLTRAFFYAGTPSVVSTLWRVDDETSGLLMERFYTHLHDGMGKAEALRQAQMDVRADYPNPYYWAGYVLSGEAGELKTDNTGNNINLLLAVVAGLLIAIAGGLYLMRRNWIVSTGRSG
jgi:CHAT domain-containing protein